MRIALDIDADIIKAAKVLADAEHKTMGQVLSELVRKGLAEVTEGLGRGIDLTRRAEGCRSAADHAGRGQAETAKRLVGSHANDVGYRRRHPPGGQGAGAR
jgi:hypothetical protein